MSKITHEALIRKREVLAMTGWSNSTLYKRISDGHFKKGVPIGARMVAWPLSEVQAHIAQCIAQRDVGANTAPGAAFSEVLGAAYAD